MRDTAPEGWQDRTVTRYHPRYLEPAPIITWNCHYCGTNSEQMGLDRMDNNIGHIHSNCLPACVICNVVRDDRFTVDEMLVNGRAIAEVKVNRADRAVCEHIQDNK